MAITPTQKIPQTLKFTPSLKSVTILHWSHFSEKRLDSNSDTENTTVDANVLVLVPLMGYVPILISMDSY